MVADERMANTFSSSCGLFVKQLHLTIYTICLVTGPWYIRRAGMLSLERLRSRQNVELGDLGIRNGNQYTVLGLCSLGEERRRRLFFRATY